MNRIMYIPLLALGVASVAAFAKDPTPEQLEGMKNATTDKKAVYHVVFVETVTSTAQQDWTDVYGAQVTLFRGTNMLLKDNKAIRGSTLPNFRAGAGKPSGWEYSVVLSTMAFPSDLKGRYYTWTRGKRANTNEPCLRLAGQAPTISVGSERVVDQFLDWLTKRADLKDYRFATDILVHAGDKANWRGSADCLTIDPGKAEEFFQKIPEGTKGTLELIRGIEDENTHSSHYY